MAYLLSLNANGLSLEIPVERETLEDKYEVEKETLNALLEALEKEGGVDEDGYLTKDGKMLLNEWTDRLSDAGFWMPKGCKLGDIMFNLKEALVFNLLTEGVSFPLKLEERLSEREAEEMLDWAAITSGLTQATPDWM